MHTTGVIAPNGAAGRLTFAARSRREPRGVSERGSTVVAALEAAYGDVRGAFRELPDAVIVTGSGLDGYGLRWGHFAYDRWADDVAQGRRPELFIGGERLATGAEQTMQTLLHECAHAIAHARGVQDTSRGHRYHNMRFVAIAEELGLAYTHEGPHPTIGFSAVTITPEGIGRWADAIGRIRTSLHIGAPDWLAGLTTGGAGGNGGGHGAPVRRPKGTGGTSNVRLTCGCAERGDPERIIRVSRATADLGAITCGVCGVDFS